MTKYYTAYKKLHEVSGAVSLLSLLWLFGVGYSIVTNASTTILWMFILLVALGLIIILYTNFKIDSDVMKNINDEQRDL